MTKTLEQRVHTLELTVQMLIALLAKQLFPGADTTELDQMAPVSQHLLIGYSEQIVETAKAGLDQMPEAA